MGYYIQTDDSINKAKFIVDNYDGERIIRPLSFASVPKGKALICVVGNPRFEAAALIYSQGEYDEFTQSDDPRQKEWLLLDLAKAHELAGF